MMNAQLLRRLLSGAIVFLTIAAVVLLLRAYGLENLVVPFLVSAALLTVIWLGSVALLHKLRTQRQRRFDAQIAAQEGIAERRLEWAEWVTELERRGIERHTLPFYMIVGEPNSGKSILLNNSDLNFIFGRKSLSGVGGTKGCDWWFTDEAIILDLAGRLFAHEGGPRDAAEWEAFLGLLAEFRPARPLNGLMLVLPCDRLLADERETTLRKAATFQEALITLSQKLQIQVPVYVVLTKADMVLGFAESVHRLAADERMRMFGWSRPAAEAGRPFDMQQVRDAWRGMLRRATDLRDAMLATLRLPEGIAEADRMYGFPTELGGIEPNLEIYLKRIFGETQSVQRSDFRGLYLTSGLQTGVPIAKACADLLGGQAETDRRDLSEIFQRQQAYFIKDLIRRRVFSERGLIRATDGRIQRVAKVARMAYVGAAVLAFGGVLVAGLQLAKGLNESRSNKNWGGSELKPRSISKNLAASSLLKDFLISFKEESDFIKANRGIVDDLEGDLQQSFNEYWSRAVSEKLFPALIKSIVDVIESRSGSTKGAMDHLIALAAIGRHIHKGESRDALLRTIGQACPDIYSDEQDACERLVEIVSTEDLELKLFPEEAERLVSDPDRWLRLLTPGNGFTLGEIRSTLALAHLRAGLANESNGNGSEVALDVLENALQTVPFPQGQHDVAETTLNVEPEAVTKAEALLKTLQGELTYLANRSGDGEIDKVQDLVSDLIVQIKALQEKPNLKVQKDIFSLIQNEFPISSPEGTSSNAPDTQQAYIESLIDHLNASQPEQPEYNDVSTARSRILVARLIGDTASLESAMPVKQSLDLASFQWPLFASAARLAFALENWGRRIASVFPKPDKYDQLLNAYSLYMQAADNAWPSSDTVEKNLPDRDRLELKANILLARYYLDEFLELHSSRSTTGFDSIKQWNWVSHANSFLSSLVRSFDFKNDLQINELPALKALRLILRDRQFANELGTHPDLDGVLQELNAKLEDIIYASIAPIGNHGVTGNKSQIQISWDEFWTDWSFDEVDEDQGIPAFVGNAGNIAELALVKLDADCPGDFVKLTDFAGKSLADLWGKWNGLAHPTGDGTPRLVGVWREKVAKQWLAQAVDSSLSTFFDSALKGINEPRPAESETLAREIEKRFFRESEARAELASIDDEGLEFVAALYDFFSVGSIGFTIQAQRPSDWKDYWSYRYLTGHFNGYKVSFTLDPKSREAPFRCDPWNFLRDGGAESSFNNFTFRLNWTKEEEAILGTDNNEIRASIQLNGPMAPLLVAWLRGEPEHHNNGGVDYKAWLIRVRDDEKVGSRSGDFLLTFDRPLPQLPEDLSAFGTYPKLLLFIQALKDKRDNPGDFLKPSTK